MSVQQLEEEKKEYEAQLELVFASLKDDPDNSELLTLKGDLEGMIQILNDSIAELKPAAPPALKKAAFPPPPLLPPKQQPEEKWSRENHPAFKKSTPAPPPPPEPAEEEVAINYQVNDSVMAKWVTGDRNFYPARITSVTGSKTAPIYTVKFKSYDTVETLRAKDIKPVGGVAGQKRKAVDSAPPPPPPPSVGSPYSTPTGGHATPAVNSGIVVAAAAEKYPQAAALDAVDKPKPKFKKIKANKELEAGKNKWQEFTTKGKFGKAVKKDSMFRTPEGVKGRVGFTGSGQAMRKDATRTRHIYQPNEELD